jgi:hypothetical protein
VKLLRAALLLGLRLIVGFVGFEMILGQVFCAVFSPSMLGAGLAGLVAACTPLRVDVDGKQIPVIAVLAGAHVLGSIVATFEPVQFPWFAVPITGAPIMALAVVAHRARHGPRGGSNGSSGFPGNTPAA